MLRHRPATDGYLRNSAVPDSEQIEKLQDWVLFLEEEMRKMEAKIESMVAELTALKRFGGKR